MKPNSYWSGLPDDQFLEIKYAPDAADRFIGGHVNRDEKRVKFIRGNLKSIKVPFDWFTPAGDGVHPDFDDLKVDDYGETVALGEYEVSTRSILRDFDPAYERRCAAESLRAKSGGNE